eukprot:scaffold265599_cov15-Tisochrysis_lutea.AAC.1
MFMRGDINPAQHWSPVLEALRCVPGAPICMHVPGAPVRPQVRTDTLQACPTCVLRGVVGVAVGPPLAARERLPRDAVTVTVARP